MKGRRLQVLCEVVKGPATSRDVSEATGIPFANCAAVLSYLHSQGFVGRYEIPRQGMGKREQVYFILGDAAQPGETP